MYINAKTILNLKLYKNLNLSKKPLSFHEINLDIQLCHVHTDAHRRTSTQALTYTAPTHTYTIPSRTCTRTHSHYCVFTRRHSITHWITRTHIHTYMLIRCCCQDFTHTHPRTNTHIHTAYRP